MVQACPSESTRQHCKCGHPPDTRGIEKESPTLNNFVVDSWGRDKVHAWNMRENPEVGSG